MGDRMFDRTELADWELSWEVDLAMQQLPDLVDCYRELIRSTLNQ